MRGAWITLLLLISFGSRAQVNTKTKATYHYLLSLPAHYNPRQAYPLVIYLHGGSQKGNDLEKLKVYGLPYLVAQGQQFDFIIASPQCPDNKYWSTENWFEPLYADLTTQYHIDTTRVYLTGVSMGGYGTYITAMDFPDKFAALLPLCGGCNDSDTSRICNLQQIPIWAFHGTADDQVDIKETIRIADKLRTCKGHMKFTPLENEGHGIQFLYEKKPEIYTWLLQQHK